MTGPQMARLVENVKRDGRLTSVPLAYRHEDGSVEVLSGNHRVKAAVDAGLEQIDVMVITTPLDERRRVAIQLSHNAIAGQDDPNVLYELYAGLDLSYKAYSGLTDDDFAGLAEVDISGLSIGSLRYQELYFWALPEDAEVFRQVLVECEKLAKSHTAYILPLRDFDKLFDAIIGAKRLVNVHNGAIGLRVMADLALERLDQLQKEKADGPNREVQSKAGRGSPKG